jgi:hypothetical protein
VNVNANEMEIFSSLASCVSKKGKEGKKKLNILLGEIGLEQIDFVN